MWIRLLKLYFFGYIEGNEVYWGVDTFKLAVEVKATCLVTSYILLVKYNWSTNTYSHNEATILHKPYNHTGVNVISWKSIVDSSTRVKFILQTSLSPLTRGSQRLLQKQPRWAFVFSVDANPAMFTFREWELSELSFPIFVPSSA